LVTNRNGGMLRLIAPRHDDDDNGEVVTDLLRGKWSNEFWPLCHSMSSICPSDIQILYYYYIIIIIIIIIKDWVKIHDIGCESDGTTVRPRKHKTQYTH